MVMTHVTFALMGIFVSENDNSTLEQVLYYKNNLNTTFKIL